MIFKINKVKTPNSFNSCFVLFQAPRPSYMGMGMGGGMGGMPGHGPMVPRHPHQGPHGYPGKQNHKNISLALR